MNRPMLAVVLVLVVIGLAITLTSGPSMSDRIASSRTCSGLVALHEEVRAEIGTALDSRFQKRAVELGC